MKNILVTGAAGSIGYETLKQLIDKKQYYVTALDLPTKKNKRKLKQFEKQAQLVYGSINEESFIQKIVVDQDVIIHLAAIIPPLADQEPERTRQVNYFGTRNIVMAIKEYNPKCFLIYSSSVSVYGDRTKDPWIQVGDPLQPSEGDYYALTKIETEQMIQESNIPSTIFRLTGIMGRPETDPLMFHMPLSTMLEIATTTDTARAFVNAIDHTKQLNHHIYNLGGGEGCRTTYIEFLNHMFDIYGLNKYYIKEKYFAKQNFHCGYFKDSDLLNKILNFRQDTLETYYDRLRKDTNPFIKGVTQAFSGLILHHLMNHSEPYLAVKKNNSSLIDRFFGKKN